MSANLGLAFRATSFQISILSREASRALEKHATAYHRLTNMKLMKISVDDG